LPIELARLDTLLEQGLYATAALWSPIRTAYAWVHEAAHVLGGEEHRSAKERRQEYGRLLATMAREKESVGKLEPAIAHFLTATHSYWKGLFHCYDVPGLPRTNNDLEQTFGSVRWGERRTTGRKRASPGLVIRGEVRIVASVATRLHRFGPEELRVRDLGAWEKLRQAVGQREEARRDQRRFRRAPATYLARAEQLLLGPALPL
jgi:hypothetical protein